MERVRHAIAQISKNLSVDAYEFPDGEIRVGMTSVSELLGFAKNYLTRLPKSSQKKLKALQQEGFTEVTKTGFVQHTDSRGSEVKTISIQDLSIWIAYEAKNGNKVAFDLAASFIEEGLEERLYHAVGRTQKTVEEKIETFEERLARISEETANSFSDEEWRETSAPEILRDPTKWESRMLSRGWMPSILLEFKSDEEIEEWIASKQEEEE